MFERRFPLSLIPAHAVPSLFPRPHNSRKKDLALSEKNGTQPQAAFI